MHFAVTFAGRRNGEGSAAKEQIDHHIDALSTQAGGIVWTALIHRRQYTKSMISASPRIHATDELLSLLYKKS